MPTPRLRSVLAALAVSSTAACYTFTPADYLTRNPSAQQIDVRCHPPDVPKHITIWARQSASGRIVTDEDEMELRLFMPHADALFVFDPQAPDPTGEAASKMYWSCPAEESDLPSSLSLFREIFCDTSVAANDTPPAPHWIAAPGNGKATCVAPKKVVTVHVCVRPPGAPDTMMEWSAVQDAKELGWELPQGKYDREAAKATVHFVYDQEAPPETAYYFERLDPNLRCPNKPAPKPLKDVLGDPSMPLLGGFVSDEAKGISPGKTNPTTTTTTTTTTRTRTKAPSNATGSGTGPKLASWEQFIQDFVLFGAILNGDVSGDINHPKGSRHGIPGGKNVGGFSFPPLQAGVGFIQVLSAAGMTPKSFVDDVIKYANLGQKSMIREVDVKLLKMADDLITHHGRYEMAKGLELMGTIMPYSMAEKFTAKLGAKFQAHKIFEKRALDRFHKGMDFGKTPAVILTEAKHTEISAKLAAAWQKNPEMSKAQLRELYKTIYAGYPQWLEAIESYLR